MPEYVDIAHVMIDAPSPIGKVTMHDVVSLKVDTSKPKKPVKTMNRQREARGFKRGTLEVSVELTVEMAMNPEVDWNYMLQADVPFMLVYERGDNGQRWQVVGCEVSEVSEEESEEGEAQQRVTIMALGHRPTPGSLLPIF